MTWLWWLLALGIAANSVRLRLRARSLAVLPPSGAAPDPEHRFLVGPGVELDEATRRAASAYARAHDLQLLELIPQDLPSELALYFLRIVLPKAYRTSVLEPGRGTGQVLLVHQDVVERAGLRERVANLARATDAELARETLRLKGFAPRRADVAIAPELRAARHAEPLAAFEFWRETFGPGLPVVLALQLAEWTLFAAGFFFAPLAALVGLALYQLQPWIAFLGGPLRPRDLLEQPLQRIARLADIWLRVVASPRASGTPVELTAQREECARLLSAGTARFFEERRGDCPLCGKTELSVWVRTTDLLQQKPGEFTLERCSCGHVFQNPRLSLEGLDFYYKDFYQGAGEDPMALVFASGHASYRARAEMVRGFASPRDWLDVGTGHGHFCLAARENWPQTAFDGIDMGSNVEDAERRGWVRKAHRQQSFPDFAPKLAATYDVVSMHHYLEHTREPLKELTAAAIALRPGGHLVIEVPDPECAYGRWLAGYWVAWFQPQHQQFLTLGNLRRKLQELGFTVVKDERGTVHIPAELSFAMYALLTRLAPPSGQPWETSDPAWRTPLRLVLLGLSVPFFAIALIGDRILEVIARAGGPSNTYRVLAQKGAQATPAADS